MALPRERSRFDRNGYNHNASSEHMSKPNTDMWATRGLSYFRANETRVTKDSVSWWHILAWQFVQVLLLFDIVFNGYEEDIFFFFLSYIFNSVDTTFINKTELF